MEKMYNVCHACQLIGMQNCSEFDICGSDSSYPESLREMMELSYEAKIPLSIIVEKAFDMGKKFQSKI